MDERLAQEISCTLALTRIQLLVGGDWEKEFGNIDCHYTQRPNGI